jgi:hypothetical protein
MIHTSVTAHGPLFDGNVPAVVDQYLADLKQQVAMQVLADVHYVLDRRIQHPTPYYETQVVAIQTGRDWDVNDRGVIYGPWLEGTSWRNSTTRFKGYHAFREAFRESQQYIKPFATRIWSRYEGQVN